MFIIFFRTFQTNTNRTEHCSVRVCLEQNFLEPLLVRFEPTTNRTGGLFGSATFEQLCSVRDRTELTEQTRTCTVRQAISAANQATGFETTRETKLATAVSFGWRHLSWAASFEPFAVLCFRFGSEVWAWNTVFGHRDISSAVLKVLGLSDPRSKSAKELGELSELCELGIVTQYFSLSIQ
jgi:hypothetical protein